MRGRGVQAEILVSLALAMVTAIGLLTAFFLQAHSAHLERLVPSLGKALALEAESSAVGFGDTVASATWFRLAPDADPLPHAVTGETLGPAGLALAREAREAGGPLLRTGRPWEPIHFAMPVSGPAPGLVAVAVLAPSMEAWVLLGLLTVDALVFAWLGGYLLRRRVVSPLRDLARVARSIEETGPGPRVRVDGVREAVEVGDALSDMSEALERQTTDLHQAVSELQSANTSLRRARDGLDRSERLAAVGHLAAGVAHEVGNPMGAVLAFLDMVGRDEALSETSRGYLNRALEQGLRVRTILGQLLDFSRPPRSTLAEFDLVDVAEQSVGLVSAQTRYSEISFDIVRDGTEGSSRVVADESIVGQILLNLVLNSADAVAGVTDPTIRLTIAARQGDCAGEVVCCVEDNGAGVAPEDRQRIFDPFFTTKPPGEGTGLGLANALRLAEELGGGLECQRPRTLDGANFVLHLRAA
jgi:C4-dicarboxylate-specific signal transduction histidine kinase